MIKYLLLATAITVTPAFADEACLLRDEVVDCETWEPIPDLVLPVIDTRPQVGRYNVVIVGTTQDTLITPIPPNLPLNLTNYTIEQFNDSRVADTHNVVGNLINLAVNNARRPIRFNHQSIIDEIQVRLDPLSASDSPQRILENYWTLTYGDRIIIYVRPLRNRIHVITYTIMLEPQ